MPEQPPVPVDLIRRLPATFGPALRDQFAQWNLLFSAERRPQSTPIHAAIEGVRSIWRISRSTTLGPPAAGPRTMAQASRQDSVSVRWLKNPLVEEPSGSRPNSFRMTSVVLPRSAGDAWMNCHIP